MRKAEQLFYLAVFSLLGTSHTASPQLNAREPTKSKNAPPNVCDFEPGAIVSDACASYSTLDGLNEALSPFVTKITQDTDFFSHYRLNLFNKKCPFWDDENGMCGNIACAVNTLDNEEDIPLVWRAQELGKLEGPRAKHPGKKVREVLNEKPLHGHLGENVEESCVVESDDECDDRDYCIPEDERADAKGDYVSLVDNPERFTGYAGPGAQQVWEAIYRENCFSKGSPEVVVQTPGSSGSSLGGFAAQDLRQALKEQGVKQGIQSAIAHGSGSARVDPIEFDDTCLEKRVFHRVISGMHASISTHLCHDYLNQTTGEWGPNLACYESRLHSHPDRVSNLYFNYALVLRAVGKVRQHIQNYSFCSADPTQDSKTKNLVLNLAANVPSAAEIFDETTMFADPSVIDLKEDFRNRFRNVSRIMDCVGCDKCRLWGKVQTAGYGAALKVLFEFDESNSENDPPLRRTELVALVNTLDRLSHSLKAIKSFRHMIEERDGLAQTPDAEPSQLPHPINDDVPPIQNKKKKAKVYDDDEEWRPKPRLYDPDETFTEMLYAEAYLVWRTYWYVMRQWWNLPRKLYAIGLWELRRLYAWWLGLSVPERGWAFRTPDEL
ncbi:endoplasmic oxidoreductin [Pseudovirgaria hyperparasitica]|uniref:Endoplasmic oxidoreductin n=1 Tax=Pseudovirgaria hyperparasitica TaxID=470096 RepID=A0A6A6VU19_9PEZI|nr:endoplasmic oxidoreductin [Pseudovirgaria hyperparasitica]KAF2754188.1 endoplasmic oxidoreductin [Pseudovirgaria hyperparasitica]